MVIDDMSRTRKSNELIILKYQKSMIARVMIPLAERKKKKQYKDMICRLMFSRFSYLFFFLMELV